MLGNFEKTCVSKNTSFTYAPLLSQIVCNWFVFHDFSRLQSFIHLIFGSRLNRHQPYHLNRKNDRFRSYLANTIGPPARLPHGQVWKPSLLTFWAIEISGWETGKENKCDLSITTHMSPSKSLRHHLDSIENHHVGTKNAKHLALPYPPNTWYFCSGCSPKKPTFSPFLGFMPRINLDF